VIDCSQTSQSCPVPLPGKYFSGSSGGSGRTPERILSATSVAKSTAIRRLPQSKYVGPTGRKRHSALGAKLTLKLLAIPAEVNYGPISGSDLQIRSKIRSVPNARALNFVAAPRNYVSAAEISWRSRHEILRARRRFSHPYLPPYSLIARRYSTEFDSGGIGRAARARGRGRGPTPSASASCRRPSPSTTPHSSPTAVRRATRRRLGLRSRRTSGRTEAAAPTRSTGPASSARSRATPSTCRARNAFASRAASPQACREEAQDARALHRLPRREPSRSRRTEVIDYAAVPASGASFFGACSRGLRSWSQIMRQFWWKRSVAGGRTREINLELYVGRGDHPTATRARLICALAGPDLLGLRAWQLSGHELGADNGGSVGLVHVVQGGGIRAHRTRCCQTRAGTGDASAALHGRGGRQPEQVAALCSDVEAAHRRGQSAGRHGAATAGPSAECETSLLAAARATRAGATAEGSTVA